MSGNTTSQKMDCSELLLHVQRAEASLPETSASCFGHPPPPSVDMIQLPQDKKDTSKELFVVAARTRRCVSTQLWVVQKSKDSQYQHSTTDPIEVLCLDGKDDDSAASMTDAGQEEIITCSALLILDDEGLLALDDSIAVSRRATVVVGTSRSRVLSVELSVGVWFAEHTLRQADEEKPFEPLPLDDPSGKSGENKTLSPGGRSGSDRQGLRKSHSGSDLQTMAESDACETLMAEASEQSHQSQDRTMTEVVTSAEDEPSATAKAEQRIIHPFRPRGGVTSLLPFASKSRDGQSPSPTVVWISYRDGTTLRLHHAGFFQSVVLQSFDQVLSSKDVLERCCVMLPPSLEDAGVTVLPLPKYHPSPLAPLQPSNAWHSAFDEGGDTTGSSVASEDDEEDALPKFYEALSYGGSGAGIGDDVPCLSFYTSENQFVGRLAGDTYEKSSSNEDHELLHVIKDNVIGGTKALVTGVFGGAIGVVKWGLGGGGDQNDGGGADSLLNRSLHGLLGDQVKADDTESVPQPPPVSVTFPSMHDEPTSLFTGFEMHDAPRQVTSVSVDPHGDLAAAADSLGRVLLIDLSTKQVVRMWKGVREASCYWIEVPHLQVNKSWQKKSSMYLVIHSKQRRVVEVWRTRHGPRVMSLQVGRDAQIIQRRESAARGSLASCLLIHSTAPGTPQNQLEPLTFDDEANKSSGGVATKRPSSPKNPAFKSTQEAALRLQLLQQLLAETNVPSDRQTVYETFIQITSLKDLCSALDLLAIASQLEESMGVDGAEFQTEAVTHCTEMLVEICVKEGGDEIYENPHVKQLSNTVKYHKQLIGTYEVLHKFESGAYSFDEEDENVVPTSAWAVEGMAWMDTYEKACSLATEGSVAEKHRVRFSDSTRARTEVLMHIFRPLLQDIFSFKVVNSIFDSMGIGDEYDYLMTCFGEWFMALPARLAMKRTFFVLNSPVVRWLREIVISQLDVSQLDGKSPPKLLLEALHTFCSESPNLVRAFLLASLCREAISVASRQREEKTYGQISSSDAVRPWDELLRKLRVVLFASLRLHGAPQGAFPITVTNVDGGIFSVYEWLARDELSVSHAHDEIVILEEACRVSGLVFHPSLSEGDDPARWKRLQKACLTCDQRAGGFPSHDVQPGALLLYLSSHNQPSLLVAQRALLLGGKWGQEPSDLNILKDLVSALQALDEHGEGRSLAAAIRVEIWQTRIRPVYRALFFGFDDVPELSEEVMGPLCGDPNWLHGLGQIALEVLSLISDISWDNEQPSNVYVQDLNVVEGDELAWPFVQEDFALKRLVEKSRRVEMDALGVHQAVVCASLVSGDLSTLSACVPDLYDAFLQSSLFSLNATSQNLSQDTAERRLEFVERAIVGRAKGTTGGLAGLSVVDSLDLGEIDTIARIWGIPLKDVRTMFLLAMYELGKDPMVDDLVTHSAQQNIDVNRFINEGIDVACRRLNDMLVALRNNSEQRYMIGLLDADTCAWVRERADDSESLVRKHENGQVNVEIDEIPLSLTHMFILRLLSLSSANAGDKATRIKVHSLSVMSGTLVEAIGRDIH